MQTIEAIVDKTGKVKLLTKISLPKNRRAILTILDEEPNEPEISQKEKLAAIFAKMQNVKMFENIENPTEWQKKLRDEWD